MQDGLKECLQSVLNTNYPNFEVIFVDNGSIDGSVEYIKTNFIDNRIKIVSNSSNLGFSKGFNSGMRFSKGKYLALLSNDMTVKPDWLNNIIELMEKSPKVGLSGFKRLIYGTKEIIDGIGGNMYLCGRVWFFPPRGIVDSGQFETIRDDIEYIGGAMVIRRKTLEEIGLLDSDFYIFSEDLDLCYRIRKQGYQVLYVPGSEIYHRGQVTLTGMDPKGQYLEYMSNRSRVRFAIIHFRIQRVLATFLIDLGIFLLCNTKSKILLLKGYLWNLKNIKVTLKRRSEYGPSPPFNCKYPVLPYSISNVIMRVQKKQKYENQNSS